MECNMKRILNEIMPSLLIGTLLAGAVLALFAPQ